MMQEEQNLGTAEQWVRTLGGNLASLARIALLIPGLATLLSGVLSVMLVLRWVEVEQDGVPIERWRRMNHNGDVHDSWKHRVLMVLYCLPTIAVVAWLVLRVRGS